MQQLVFVSPSNEVVEQYTDDTCYGCDTPNRVGISMLRTYEDEIG